MKHRIILILAILIIIPCIAIITCNIIVNGNAKDRIFDHAKDVPQMNTALLLGTSPKSRFTHGTNLFYQARIDATVQLYKDKKFHHLIISGAKRPGYDEPSAMRKDLMQRGIPDSIISLDGEGHRTLLSIKNMRQNYKVDSLIIISQKWHNERTIYLADKMKMYAVGYNAKDVNNRFARLTHVRELLARVKLFADIYLLHRKDF